MYDSGQIPSTGLPGEFLKTPAHCEIAWSSLPPQGCYDLTSSDSCIKQQGGWPRIASGTLGLSENCCGDKNVKNIFTLIFIAILFTKEKTWNQCKGPIGNLIFLELNLNFVRYNAYIWLILKTSLQIVCIILSTVISSSNVLHKNTLSIHQFVLFQIFLL